MRKNFSVSICLLVALILTCCRSNEEVKCTSTLQANKEAYSPGDQITLTVFVTPVRETVLCFHKKNEELMLLLGMSRTSGNSIAIDQRSNDFECQSYSPTKPFTKKIEGRVVFSKVDPSKVVLDFGELGEFETDAERLAISVAVFPNRRSYFSSNNPITSNSELIGIVKL